MKKIIISALIGIIFSVGTTKAQQIPLFSSYTLNNFLLNPSYAGSNGKTNIFGMNRIQYAGFDGAPVTYMLTADAGFKDKKFGLGGSLFSDRNNLIAQNGFSFAYAYNIKLNDSWKIGMGLNAGMVQWTLNFDNLKVDDYSEDVLSNIRSGASTFRSDFGFRLSSDKIEFGVAIPQLVTSKVKYSDYIKNSDGQYTTVPHYIINASYLLSLNDAMKLKPMVVVRGAKGVSSQVDVVALLDWKSKAYATVGYRMGYAATIGGGVRLGRGVTFGYSYDRPINAISTVSGGSHEFVLGITLGERASDKPEPAPGLNKDAEAKLKADMEKQIRDKLTVEFDAKLKQELDLKVNKAVEEKVAKALADRPATTTTTPTTTDGKTAPTTGATATLTKEEVEKIKRDIEASVKKQMEESLAKLVDEKIKKANEGKPAAPVASNKEETEKLRKESEEKIKKEVEQLRKEMADKINTIVAEKLNIEIQKQNAEIQKQKETAEKLRKENEDAAKKVAENEKRLADLEKQMKGFTPDDKIENTELMEIRRVVRANDLELKKFKGENKLVLDKAADSKSTAEEDAKFFLVLAAFKSQKEAQNYQKLAAQTFEFPGTKIMRPSQLDGYYFVYYKSFQKKKLAWEAHEKIFEKEFQTPNFPWVYVSE